MTKSTVTPLAAVWLHDLTAIYEADPRRYTCIFITLARALAPHADENGEIRSLSTGTLRSTLDRELKRRTIISGIRTMRLDGFLETLPREPQGTGRSLRLRLPK